MCLTQYPDRVFVSNCWKYRTSWEVLGSELAVCLQVFRDCHPEIKGYLQFCLICPFQLRRESWWRQEPTWPWLGWEWELGGAAAEVQACADSALWVTCRRSEGDTTLMLNGIKNRKKDKIVTSAYSQPSEAGPVLKLQIRTAQYSASNPRSQSWFLKAPVPLLLNEAVLQKCFLQHL